MKDMVEWNIVTTSDKCPYIDLIENWNDETIGIECNHPENSSCSCSSEKCPIIIKDKK